MDLIYKSFFPDFDSFNLNSISSIEIGPLFVHTTFGKHSNNPSRFTVFGNTNLLEIKCNLKYASAAFLIGSSKSFFDQSSIIIS